MDWYMKFYVVSVRAPQKALDNIKAGLKYEFKRLKLEYYRPEGYQEVFNWICVGLWIKVQYFNGQGKCFNIRCTTQIMVYICFIIAHLTTFDTTKDCI